MATDVTGGLVAGRDPASAYRRAKNLVITKREGPAGAGSTYFVKTSAKQVYQFGEEEHLLIQLLDGRRLFAEVQAEFKREIGGELSREQFEGFLSELLQCGIVEAATAELPRPVEDDLKVFKDEPAPARPPEDLDDLYAEPDASDLAPAPRQRFALRLFDPAPALKALDWLAGPLRFYRWLLLPVAFACLIAAARSTAAMQSELAGLPGGLASGRTLAILAAALVIVDLVPTIAQAAMASFLGCPSRSCSLGLRLFVVPRLLFSDAEWGGLREGEALEVAAAPLTARAVLFASAIGLWLFIRQDGGLWPDVALAIGMVALGAIVLGSAPFAPTTGRRFLTTLFGRTELWRDGGFYRAHLLALSGLWVLGTAGVAALCLRAAPPVSFSGLAGLGAAYDQAAEVAAPILARITLPLLTIVPLAGWLWLRLTVKSVGVSRVTYLPAAFLPPAGPPSARAPDKSPGIVVPLNRDLLANPPPSRRPQSGNWPSAKLTLIFATIVAICLAFGFVPYPYEAGGNFTILPHDSAQLNARIQGELTEVMVNEGDKVVPGQILGILSDWDEQANLDVSKAQLENAKASLQALYETPKPEDVELARKQYELAMSKLPYDKAQFDRASVLVKTDAVSRSNYDQIVSQYQQDQAAADVARANYDDVRTGPTPGQLDAARATLRQSAATVAYNEDQLERTRIRATSYGEVVTANPMLLRGQWFAQGALVLTVQDLSSVQADVQVPETDIGHVLIGGITRLRPWGYAEKTFLGHAVGIAGDAQPDPGGSGTNIIRVRTEIPNPDGELHPTMSGYAKITGYYMPTWKAFLQIVIRFFLVEIWSFIP